MTMIAVDRENKISPAKGSKVQPFTHFSSPQEEGSKLGFLFTHSQGENPNGIGEPNLNLQEGTSLCQARGWGGYPIAHSVPGYYGQRATRNSSIGAKMTIADCGWKLLFEQLRVSLPSHDNRTSERKWLFMAV